MQVYTSTWDFEQEHGSSRVTNSGRGLSARSGVQEAQSGAEGERSTERHPRK